MPFEPSRSSSSEVKSDALDGEVRSASDVGASDRNGSDADGSGGLREPAPIGRSTVGGGGVSASVPAFSASDCVALRLCPSASEVIRASASAMRPRACVGCTMFEPRLSGKNYDFKWYLELN